MPPQKPELTAWFTQNLQPHEPLLRAWLRSRFPGHRDIDDVVQEAFTRVLRAHEAGLIESPRAFLFATARNLVLGRLRHERVSGEAYALAETELQNVMDEAADVPHAVAHAQELELLTHAIQSLPTRCRQVVTLRKIYGLSQKEVAAQLGISEHTVEAQGTIALRKLGEFFARVERSRRTE